MNFLNMTPKSQATKENKTEFNQNLKLLCFKGQYQESGKITQRVREHI